MRYNTQIINIFLQIYGAEGFRTGFFNCFLLMAHYNDKIWRWPIYFYLKKMSIRASLGKLMLLSSQALWFIENSAVARIRVMAHRLKTSVLQQRSQHTGKATVPQKLQKTEKDMTTTPCFG